METYKNSYSVKEDEVLWELHEIRHELHEELKSKPLEAINRGARKIFESWKNNDKSQGKSPEGHSYLLEE